MRKTVYFLITLILAIEIVPKTMAEPLYDGSIYRFNDYDEVLSDEESQKLNDRINETIESLQMDFPIFILDKYDYDMEHLEYAKTVYENNKFGYGTEKSGIFLIVDNQSKTYDLFFFGKAIGDIPKAKRAELTDILDTLYDSSENSYFEVISGYLDAAFSLTQKWHIEKGDKDDGMPYWFVDDVYEFQNYHAENPQRVVDNAGILTDEELLELTEQVERICVDNDFSYVIFIDDSTHGLSKETYSADFLYYGGYGKDDDFSAICFFLSLEEGNRGWRTTAINSYENIFTGDVRYTIDEIVDSDMRGGNYFEAIKKQADYIEKSLNNRNFEIIEPKSEKTNPFGWPLIVSIIIALVIAEMVIESMKQKMRIYTQVSANEYLQKGSLEIRNRSIKFLYSTITRTEKSESSGGGSSHSSGSASSGGSYSSSGRDF